MNRNSAPDVRQVRTNEIVNRLVDIQNTSQFGAPTTVNELRELLSHCERNPTNGDVQERYPKDKSELKRILSEFHYRMERQQRRNK